MTANASTEAPAPWLRICVTGGIACGKSLVGAYLEALGVAVIEADTVCHDLMRAGTPLFPRIVAAFGREILASDGSIDRAVLGRRVFDDAAALGRLNALLHPAAQGAIEAWVLARREEARLQPVAAISDQKSEIRNQKSEIINSVQVWRGGVAAIIPLLYETAWEAAWDLVICVGAPIALQRKRLRSKGFTEKEAHDRMAAQWPVEEKMKRADYVVFNAGTQMCAQRQTVQVMQHIGIHVENSDGR
ncbi:MAG: dephospho-CoA kinase [Verrucomicrobia bacterium]|nr:dephospho-CoA kinase [Verrucomicrobiota bacterium]MBU1734384.1 dephospho-CoA kinase [Verrucomicrobiota bacterium]MBU1857559.1 dephospho-CoA kinase [Verrucomicrobiota bacterium]